MNKYKTMYETYQHKNVVTDYLNGMVKELLNRSLNHDNTKLENFEVDLFTEYTPKLKEATYGSKEYEGLLTQMKPALTHHYENNRHHPEHYTNGITDMTLIDLVEMLCDWKAASLRHSNGNIESSIEYNKKRFNYSDELEQIFKNTVKEFLE